MYTVTITPRDFVAQHFLIGGDWGAENLWHWRGSKVEVRLEGPTLDRHGYLVISWISRAPGVIVGYFRDETLNEMPSLPASSQHRAFCAHRLSGPRRAHPSPHSGGDHGPICGNTSRPGPPTAKSCRRLQPGRCPMPLPSTYSFTRYLSAKRVLTTERWIDMSGRAWLLHFLRTTPEQPLQILEVVAGLRHHGRAALRWRYAHQCHLRRY